MIKAILKKIQQWLCPHSEVLMAAGAKHKAGWDHFHKVTCRLCNKVWREKGHDLYLNYTKEVDCTCIFKK